MITDIEWSAFAFYLIATLADLYTTKRGLAGGGVEVNPILKGKSFGKIAAKDALVTGFVLLGLWYLDGVFAVFAVVYGLIHARAAWRNTKTEAYRRG